MNNWLMILPIITFAIGYFIGWWEKSRYYKMCESVSKRKEE